MRLTAVIDWDRLDAESLELGETPQPQIDALSMDHSVLRRDLLDIVRQAIHLQLRIDLLLTSQRDVSAPLLVLRLPVLHDEYRMF